jgi:hypothetical protein
MQWQFKAILVHMISLVQNLDIEAHNTDKKIDLV